MDRDAIQNKVNRVMLDKFGFHAENLTDKQKSESLLTPKIGLYAIDMLVLYMELEKTFKIQFQAEDVIKNRFDVYENIIDIVEMRLGTDSKESVSQ